MLIHTYFAKLLYTQWIIHCTLPCIQQFFHSLSLSLFLWCYLVQKGSTNSLCFYVEWWKNMLNKFTTLIWYSNHILLQFLFTACTRKIMNKKFTILTKISFAKDFPHHLRKNEEEDNVLNIKAWFPCNSIAKTGSTRRLTSGS